MAMLARRMIAANVSRPERMIFASVVSGLEPAVTAAMMCFTIACRRAQTGEPMAHAGMELVGRYLLRERLGGGGMGEVWRGTDRQLDRSVAVKMMRELFTDPELAARFQLEARIAARLQHPGIVVVHDVGSHDGQLFIVMELLHGRDLAAVLGDAPAGLPIASAVSLIIQAADALQAAHAAHVIHRDLKPANLFLLNSGQLKICDFGLARAADATGHLTATGQVMGTPAYMSPEQCEGRPADERSDLYSLGCVLYALLVGRPPFFEGQPLAIMLQHLNTVPASPRTIRSDIPDDLDGLIMSLLAKSPADRPRDARRDDAALRAIDRAAAVSPARPAMTPLPDRPHGAGLGHRAPAEQRLPVGTPEALIKVSHSGSDLAVSATAIAITPDGTTAYVASSNGGQVFPVDLANRHVGTPIRVMNGTHDIAITPDGRTAYVTHAGIGTGTVTPINCGAPRVWWRLDSGSPREGWRL